jgi:hypothetical protein
MEHIHSIITGIAYTLQIMNRRGEFSLPGVRQRAFLPAFNGNLQSEHSLDVIMGVVEQKSLNIDEWMSKCTKEYLTHPLIERDEFLQHLYEYFEVVDTRTNRIFDYLELNQQGTALGREVYEDRPSALYTIVTSINRGELGAKFVYIIK